MFSATTHCGRGHMSKHTDSSNHTQNQRHWVQLMQGETSIWKKYRLLKSTEEKPFKIESFPNNESKIQVPFISENPLKCEYVQGFQAPKQTWYSGY